MINLYQSNPSNWKSKDAALHLMLAVTVRAESAIRGALGPDPLPTPN